MLTQQQNRKVVVIMLLIIVTEGTWVCFNWWKAGARFWNFLGFTASSKPPGWLLAIIVVILFVAYGIRLPAVKEHLLKISVLKLMAILLAFNASILEEVFFRKQVMDILYIHQFNAFLQVTAAGLSFGLIHGIWGLFGKNIRASAAAVLATGVLGMALAIVYLVSGRSLAPCILAHFFINALLEPGLVIAAVCGEMGMAFSGTGSTR